MRVLHLLYLVYILAAEDDVPPTLMEDMEEKEIDRETPSLEEWVDDAILNVGYYLRSHKFNDFDRRYQDEHTGKRNFYQHFPEPPLRLLHWEVHKYCEKGFLECVRYLNNHINQTDFHRTYDPIYSMHKYGYNLENNKSLLMKINRNCKRNMEDDKLLNIQFQSPLKRFQWRASASYYMCWFTIKRQASLSAFGEPCDNYASCFWEKNEFSNEDPRADDRQPYHCAMYSFCPDPCCPLGTIKGYDECREESPCTAGGIQDRYACSIDLASNQDFASFAINHWNLTCDCSNTSYVWDSRFGSCVDMDECSLEVDTCDNKTEVCMNTEGSYVCICRHGYTKSPINGSCQISPILHSIN